MLIPLLVAHLARFRKYGLLEGSMSLEAGFEGLKRNREFTLCFVLVV